MIPVLLSTKFMTIYTFGVFLVLAFFWGSFLLWKLGRLTAYKEEEIFDGLFVSVFGGLLVGRLIYIVFHFSDFGLDVVRYILINGYPGLSLPACIAGGLVVFWLFCLIRKVKMGTIIDYAVSPLFLALGIGKLGAFLSGAEVGTRTKFPLAIRYANYEGLRHLTPLYESLVFFIAAFIAYRLLFRIRRELLPKGFTALFFAWVFSLSYTVFDMFKDDHVIAFGVHVYFVLSLIALLTSTMYFVYYWRNFLIRIFHANKTTQHSIHQKTEGKA